MLSFEAVVVQSRKLFFFAVQEPVETILEGDRQALDAAVHFLPPLRCVELSRKHCRTSER